MVQYVQISNDIVTTVFGCHQPVTSDKPGYAEIADNDPRFLAWQAARAATAAASTLLAGGLAVTSTGTPSLNATYPCDPVSQQLVTSDQVYIATTGKFTNGGTTRGWKDITGTLHTFASPADFTTFAEAVAQFVDAVAAALDIALAGGSWVAPSNNATIG